MKFIIAISALLFAVSAQAAEYHVAKTGADTNDGSAGRPFLTIQRAADRAQAGDTITVHAGVYRERVNPPRGGASDEQRITYQAAPGETVEIKGSEVVTGWEKVQNDTWMLKLPNDFFGDFNPYSDVLDGHWFQPGDQRERRPDDRVHHTGSVYLNGVWRGEAASLEEVLKPAAKDPLWFGQVTDKETTIWAQFPGVDPNGETVEINARQTVFFPEQTGLNYITVRGFVMRHAATPWSAPTQQQKGLIGPHWSKGWIIEDNVISHSITVGVQLGTTYQGEYTGNADGYTQLLKDCSESGAWSKDKVGGHIVRRNRISHCEAAGINGSMGAAFSLIEGNYISDIHMRRAFTGMEQGGIKLHGAIDTVIRNNVVCRTGFKCRAIWLDWLGQGAVIEGNIVFDSHHVDLFLEVSHGPTLVANNIFLSGNSVCSTARGTAYVNNYFNGRVSLVESDRVTPYAEAHSTRLAGDHGNKPEDDRYINNIFARPGASFAPAWPPMNKEKVDAVRFDMQGNLYLNGAKPPVFDKNPTVLADVKPPFRLVNQDGVFEWTIDSAWLETQIRPVVTAERLGKAVVTGLPFEMPDGSPVRVDRDFLDSVRGESNCMPGPIEQAGSGSFDPASWLDAGDADPKRPNVILIMTDDQGYGDLACHGNPIIKTPHLDQLHKDGVRLTNFHVDPVCAPTRAALMTGRYSRRAGVWNVVGNPSILPEGETTMGDLFTKAGYRTAIFGKWHLGDNYPYRPEDRGFQEVITMGGGVVGHTPDYWLNDYFDDTYRHNGCWERFPGYCTDVWFDHAIEFARGSGDQPFFIYLPVNAPHTPLQVPESYKKPYAGQSEEIQRFYGMIANIDQNVGRLRTELKKAGLERNTILIFMTDNGTTQSRVFNAGMRGQKASPYEGGHRVPCFIHWPDGQIAGGRDVDRLTAHFDLLPTLANLCRLPVPKELHFDGRDLTPLLSDPDATWEDRTMFVEWQGVIKPQKWKRSCVMTQRWRLINGRELYDMETSPDQTEDVAPAHPEMVTQLRSAYERWWNEVCRRDDMLREIPVGAVAEPSVRLTAYDWITRTGRQQDMPWGQVHIVKGPLQNGYWALRVERAGDYRIRLRRWPVESGLAINETTDVVPPEKSWHPVKSAVLKAIRARITIQDIDQTQAVAATDKEAVFDVRLKAGGTRLQTWFYDDAERSRGAYYVHIQYRGSVGDTK